MNGTDDKRTEENPNQIFFQDKGSPANDNKQKTDANASRSSEFTGKTSNRKLDSSISYDIHFIIGGGTFNNLITYMSNINYIMAFVFRKKEVRIVAIDPGQTHGAMVKISNIEFTDYSIKGLEKDDDEKWILIDSSVITDDMSINEEKQLDFYVDTLDKNRFYVVNGKEKGEKQLSEGGDALLNKPRGFSTSIERMINDDKYQKVVVNYAPFTGVIKSLSKKTDKQKDVSTICSLHLTKYDLDFIIEKETKSLSVMLSGEDVVVCPLRDDTFRFNLKFFNKIGSLKFNNSVEMYICGQLPIIISSRLGGGGIRMYYLLAPRTDTD